MKHSGFMAMVPMAWHLLAPQGMLSGCPNWTQHAGQCPCLLLPTDPERMLPIVPKGRWGAEDWITQEEGSQVIIQLLLV